MAHECAQMSITIRHEYALLSASADHRHNPDESALIGTSG
jgi:hypothetical protein